jgi:hypothetical protein
LRPNCRERTAHASWTCHRRLFRRRPRRRQEATLARLLELGATEHDPITRRGDGTKDFATAAVVDPFGNVLGIMYNPHYVSILERD